MRTDLDRFKDIILNNSLLCDSDKSLFKPWKCELKEAKEKLLVYEGEIELLEMAERFQNRFPGLLSEFYDNSTYKVFKCDTCKKNCYLICIFLVQIHRHRKDREKL